MYKKVSLLTVLFAVSANAAGYASGYGSVAGLGGAGLVGGGGLGVALAPAPVALPPAPVALAPAPVALPVGGCGGGCAAGAGNALLLAGGFEGALPVAAAPLALPVAAVEGPAGPLAVVSKHRVNYIPTPSYGGYSKPKKIYVDSHMTPVKMVVRTLSSPVLLAHQHVPSRGSFRQTASVDEPHRHVHTVTKPIIQEVNEVITPMRIIRQQIQPLQEQVLTNIARNVPAGGAAGGAAGAGGAGGFGPGGFGSGAGLGGAAAGGIAGSVAPGALLGGGFGDAGLAGGNLDLGSGLAVGGLGSGCGDGSCGDPAPIASAPSHSSNNIGYNGVPANYRK